MAQLDEKVFIRRFHNINYFQIFQTICSKITHPQGEWA
nr:MAG TPA: hypothetical protein [Caudoviricetes sp.]